jgi:4-diphosphocytidyl-2-C-methyl-D-erythritol kinase
MTLTFPAFAKINWTLEVLGRRADGYHELRTLLQTVSLCDELRFTPTDSEIEIVCDAPGVPCDETNLAHRAATLLREFTGLKRGARVEIIKRIPPAGGLGGGSSNAAVTLMVLQRLWGVRLKPRDLFALGAKLGADVPCFFLGGTCLGIGRGDEVYPLAEIQAEHLLLVNAGIAVPTREAYAALPPELTKPHPAAMMPFALEAAYGSVSLQSGPPTQLSNDLERPVLARYPLLSEIKQRLTQAGACAALMSGSGSTIFGVFDSEAARGAAQEALSRRGWWCAEARALSRAEYRAALQAEADLPPPA